MFAIGSPGSPFASPKNTPPSSSPLRTPSPKGLLETSVSPKCSSSDDTPPQFPTPSSVTNEKDAECRPSKSRTVSIKRRNSRRKVTGVDVSPDYATFRDRTKEDSITRKLSLPQKAITEVSNKAIVNEGVKPQISATNALSSAGDSGIQRRRTTSEVITNRKSLQDINLASLQAAQQPPLGHTTTEDLSGRTVGINRTHSSPAFLSEVVKRLPLPLKSDSDTGSQNFSDFLLQIATESLATAPLSKLSSPIFKMSDQVDSPQSDFGGSTPPNLFQISPHSWSELAELAVARERKLSLSKRSVSRTPSDTSERSERKKTDDGSEENKAVLPHVTTCKGSKVTVGFEESPNSKQQLDKESDSLQGSSGIDTHIGTVFLHPPDLPEETLMPSEHLKVMELIESKRQYANSIIDILGETEIIWSETHELFVKNSKTSRKRELETLIPSRNFRSLQEMALLSEAIQVFFRIIEFSQQELAAGNLRPTKAMKSGMSNFHLFYL